MDEVAQKLSGALTEEIERLQNALAMIAACDRPLLELALATFDTPGAAALWLATPQKALKEQPPLRIAATPEGTKAVLDALGAIKSGTYL